MVAEVPRSVPTWFSWAELASVLLAASLWIFLPSAGPWPLLLPLGCWTGRLAITGRPTRRTPFDLLLLFFLLTAAIGIWAAYDREAAWSKFWLIASSILLFYALVNTRQYLPDAGVWIATGLGAGITLYFLATHDWTLSPVKAAVVNTIGQSIQANLPPLPGPRINANEVGGLLAMLLPFAGWGSLQTYSRFQHRPGLQNTQGLIALILALGALALMAFGLVMSASRGAWLALGAAALISLVWTGSGWLSQSALRQRLRLFAGILALTLLIAAGVLILWRSYPAAWQNNLLSLDTWHNRREFQSRSATLVRDYPFIGSGLGGFEMLYSTYVMLIHVGFITNSHNLFLSIAIDQGLPALLSLIAMWVLFAVIAWRTVVVRRFSGERIDPDPSPLGVAVLSLIVALAHGMVESTLYGSGVVLLFFPLAYAVKARGRPSKVHMRLGVAALLICLCIPLALMLLQPRRALSLTYSNLGSIHQSQAELSVYQWPEWVLQDEVRDSVNLDKVIGEFEQALAWDPWNATANRRLAMIELAQGRYQEALRHLKLAYAVEPENMTTRQLLGEALIVNGRETEGRAQWQGLSNDQEQFQIRAFWYEYIGDEERAEWIRQAAERP